LHYIAQTLFGLQLTLIVFSFPHTCDPSNLLPHLALTSLQADIKLGQPAHGPHVTPAAGGQFILHRAQYNFASLSAPGLSSAQGTDQVWHALLHTGLCAPSTAAAANLETFLEHIVL